LSRPGGEPVPAEAAQHPRSARFCFVVPGVSCIASALILITDTDSLARFCSSLAGADFVTGQIVFVDGGSTAG